MSTETDEDRWAEAQSLMDRRPTEAAEQRLSRWRRGRLLFVFGFAAAGVTLGMVLVLLVGGGTGGAEHQPLWREVTGVVVSGLGCVLALVGLVAVVKANRRLRVWRNPLAPLTRSQRKLLAAQVRGRAPVQPERLPLARYTAELLVNQRLAWITQFAMLVLWAGIWIADPHWWHLALAAGFAILAFVGGFFVRRDGDRAQRFLETYPVTDGSVA